MASAKIVRFEPFVTTIARKFKLPFPEAAVRWRTMTAKERLHIMNQRKKQSFTLPLSPYHQHLKLAAKKKPVNPPEGKQGAWAVWAAKEFKKSASGVKAAPKRSVTKKPAVKRQTSK